VARRAIRRVESEDAFASSILDQELEQTELEERDRALATELVYGVIRYRLRLDRALNAYAKKPVESLSAVLRIALEVGAYQLMFLDKVPAHAAVNDAVAAVKQIAGSSMAGFANGLLRQLDKRGEPPLPPLDFPIVHAEIAYSTPHEIVELVAEALGQDAIVPTALQALNTPGPLWIRVNRSKTIPEFVAEELRRAGAEVVRIDGDAVALRGLGSPAKAPGFQEGLWTVQDLGAQWVSRVAPVHPGMRVLDACAGLGGKTTHLGALLGGKGVLDAVDLSDEKLQKLRDLWDRLGISGVELRTIADDARHSAHVLAHDYDVVLIDAPCSGLGVMRRHPERKLRFERSQLEELGAVQASLLDSLADVVKPGGALVYAVCSFALEEGSHQIRDFLVKRPDYSLESAIEGRDGWMQTWPHADDADAFFIARLARNP
jgi:16S rRNA (cytosine967-C5)-methyltransferase